MDSILWYQHADLNVGDVICYNGVRVENQIRMKQYFDTIKVKADEVVRKPSPWCGKVSGVFFMKGYLTSHDEKGRIMSFMYMTKDKNYREACKNELNAAGLLMSNETEDCLNNTKKHTWKFYVTFLCIALIFVVIVTLATNSN